MSDTIYRYDFRIGKKTRWVYRLDVSAASETPLSGSPTIIPIPDFAVKLKTVKYPGYGAYNIGMQDVPSMTLEWDLNYLVDVTTTANPYDYTELKAAILRPIISVYNGFVVPHTYKLSTVYKLYIQYIGNDTSPTPPIRPLIYALQLNPKPGEYDVITKKVIVECLDASDWAFKANKPFTYFTYGIILGGPDGYIEREGYLELFYRPSQGSQDIVSHLNKIDGTQSYKLWFVNLESFWTNLDLINQSYYRQLVRNSTVLFSTGSPDKLIYYKQSSDGTGGKGTALAFNNLYILALYNDIDKPYRKLGGCFGEVNSGIPTQWKGGMRDFLNDMYLSEFVRGIPIVEDGAVDFAHIGDASLLCYALFEDNGFTLTINKLKLVTEGKIKNFAKGQDAIVNAITSLYEHKDKDTAKYEETDRSTFNEDTCQLPIMFNNIPTACKYEKGSFEEREKLNFDTVNYFSALFVDRDSNKSLSHDYGLFYFEQPYCFNAPMPFRVHEYIDGDLGDGKTIEGLSSINYADLILSPYNFIYNDPDNPADYPRMLAYIQALQSITGKGFILAKALKDIYGDDRLTKMEIEVPFYLYTQFGMTPSIGFPWGSTGFKLKFSFDSSTLDEEYSDIPTSWYMISSELNFETEMTTVVLMSRMI